MKKLLTASATILALTTLGSLTALAVNPSENVYSYNGGSNAAFDAISSTDLLESGSSTFGSMTATKAASTDIVTTENSGLNDGLSLLSGFGNSTYYGYNDPSNGGGAKANLIDGNQLGDGGVTVTFNLNTSVNTLGYDITGINTIAGWQDHASVANQDYTVSYSTIADPTLFLSLGSVSYNPNDPTNDDPGDGGVATEVSFTSLSLTGVAALQFHFTADPTSLGYGDSATGTWYQEVDAFGTPTVPEPGTWAMCGIALAGLGFLVRGKLSRI